MNLPEKLRWKNWPLAVKLTLTFTLLIVVAIGNVTFLSMRREQQGFRTELEQQAQLLLDALAGTIANPLYRLDVDTLQDTVEGLVSSRILGSGRVYNPEGRVIADGYDPSGIFHLESSPFGQRLIKSESLIFDWQADQLIAGKAVRLGNRTLGAISIGLSTAPLEAKVAAVRNQGIGVASGTAVVGLLLALFLSRSITGPVQELVRITQKLGAGDFTSQA